jgi:hypothetical protein
MPSRPRTDSTDRRFAGDTRPSLAVVDDHLGLPSALVAETPPCSAYELTRSRRVDESWKLTECDCDDAVGLLQWSSHRRDGGTGRLPAADRAAKVGNLAFRET